MRSSHATLGGVPLTSEDASYVEFGEDPNNIEFVTLDLPTQTGRITSLVPLNLYSRVEERFDVVLRFNQPVNASSTNVSDDRIRFVVLEAGIRQLRVGVARDAWSIRIHVGDRLSR